MISHPKLSVKLDTITEPFLGQLFRWRNSPEVFKWCRQNDLINAKSHHAWYERQSVDPKIRMYLIREEAGVPVGACGLTDMDFINQRAEFSLYIDPAMQGQGYGKQALRLLCWHGFHAYPLKIIWGESFEGNHAVDMFKKVGFQQEGKRRDFYFREGRHIDAILFSIKREELVLEDDQSFNVVNIRDAMKGFTF